MSGRLNPPYYAHAKPLGWHTEKITDLPSLIASFRWSEPRKIVTRQGEDRMIRNVEIPVGHIFWDFWKSQGWKLKAAGFTLRKFNHTWTLTQWIQEDTKPEDVSFEPQAEEDCQEAAPAANPPLSAEQEAVFESLVAKLLPWQPQAARALTEILNGNNAGLDASDTGVGKTYVALACCKILGRNPAIICPKAIIPSWRKAAYHFSLTPVFASNYEAVKSERFMFGNFVEDGNKVNYVWNLPPNPLLIFDECQKCKSQKTDNAKLLVGAKDSGVPIICLSATAAATPVDMYALGYAIGLHNRKNFYKWAFGYGMRKSRFGFMFSGTGDSLKRLHTQIFPHRGIRVRIADLGDQFPETQITAEPYDTGNAKEIDIAYDEMFNELAALEARDDMSASERSSNRLVVQLRARQKTELLKVPVFVQLVQDAIENGMQVAIFVNFLQTLSALSGRLKTLCVIKGGQSIEDRQQNIELFQDGKSKIIISQIQSGGVGISLHGANRLAIISPTWSAIDLKQALGRVHRAGGEKSIQKIIYAADTIEESVCEKVRIKLQLISALNDGDLAPGMLF